MKQTKTLFLVEVALFTTLAFIFDYLSGIVGLKIWAQGGSVSIAMVPIFIIAFRWGIKGGMIAGLLLGVLQIATGQAWIAHPVQGFLEYFVAFAVLGLAGVFATKVQRGVEEKSKKKVISYVVAGTLLGSVLRFFAHFIAGIVFFAEYAPEGTPVHIYSFLYNGSYMLPSFIISAIFVSILINAIPKYFTVNQLAVK